MPDEVGEGVLRKTVRTGGDAVIRQAISCDICATEKKQTNHWFVAYEQGGELRVSGWQLAQSVASRVEAFVRANLPAQAGGRIHGKGDRRAWARGHSGCSRGSGTGAGLGLGHQPYIEIGLCRVGIVSTADSAESTTGSCATNQGSSRVGDDAWKAAYRSVCSAGGRAAALCLAQLAHRSMGSRAGTRIAPH